MLPPELGSHAFLKIRNPIRNPELELDPNPRSGAPKKRIFEKLNSSCRLHYYKLERIKKTVRSFVISDDDNSKPWGFKILYIYTI